MLTKRLYEIMVEGRGKVPTVQPTEPRYHTKYLPRNDYRERMFGIPGSGSAVSKLEENSK